MEPGITEFDEDWYPFNFAPPKTSDENSEGNEDSDIDADGDGVSDTWSAGGDSEREDGEILPEGMCEDDTIAGAEIDRDENPPAAGKSPEAAETAEDSTSKIETTQMMCSPRKDAEESHVQMDALNVENIIPPGVFSDTNYPDGAQNDPVDTRDPHKDEAVIGLRERGCFGPFPSPISPILNTAIPSSFDLGGSLGKRRRLDRGSSRLDPLSHSHANGPRVINLEAAFSPAPDPIAPPVSSHPTNMPTLDLNKCTSDSVSEGTSSRMELERTVEIGKELGFEIEMGDPILKEVMGEKGENMIIP
ncbi:hypothetical protein L1887_31397 [Cichorium endivia]|nr:hypothetical protein L1887_31397 [Cichorium endivia]